MGISLICDTETVKRLGYSLIIQSGWKQRFCQPSNPITRCRDRKAEASLQLFSCLVPRMQSEMGKWQESVTQSLK